jgi:hypothetical protein
MNPPILEAEEIPYDPAQKRPGVLVMEITFERAEIDRLKARSSRGSEPLGRFIKRAALEAADREARRHTADELREAD